MPTKNKDYEMKKSVPKSPVKMSSEAWEKKYREKLSAEEKKVGAAKLYSDKGESTRKTVSKKVDKELGYTFEEGSRRSEAKYRNSPRTVAVDKRQKAQGGYAYDTVKKLKGPAKSSPSRSTTKKPPKK